MISGYKAFLGLTSIALLSWVTYDPSSNVSEVEDPLEGVGFDEELLVIDETENSFFSNLEDIPLFEGVNLADVVSLLIAIATNQYFHFAVGFAMEMWYISYIGRQLINQWLDEYSAKYKALSETGNQTIKDISTMEEEFAELASAREQQFAEVQATIERLQQQYDAYVARNGQKMQEVIALVTKRLQARGEPLANFSNENIQRVGSRTGIPIFVNSPRPLRDSSQFQHLFNDNVQENSTVATEN